MEGPADLHARHLFMERLAQQCDRMANGGSHIMPGQSERNSLGLKDGEHLRYAGLQKHLTKAFRNLSNPD